MRRIKKGLHIAELMILECGLQNRWSNVDQALFILAYILHPGKVRDGLNVKATKVTTTALQQVAGKYFERFFGTNEDNAITLQVQTLAQINKFDTVRSAHVYDVVLSQWGWLLLKTPVRECTLKKT